MSVGDVVADYVLAAGDPAEVLALTLVALEARGVVPDIRAITRWRWVSSRRAERNRITVGGLVTVARINEYSRGRWYGAYGDRLQRRVTGREQGYASAEEVAALVDELLRDSDEDGFSRRAILAPGGLPPRPT